MREGNRSMSRLNIAAFQFADPIVATLLRLLGMDGLWGRVATCHLQGLDNHARYGYSFDGGRV